MKATKTNQATKIFGSKVTEIFEAHMALCCADSLAIADVAEKRRAEALSKLSFDERRMLAALGATFQMLAGSQ